MLDIKVVYDESGEDYLMTPVWMIIDSQCFDWAASIYINIQTPFERLIFDNIDSEVLAVTVPENAYIRHVKNEQLIGVNLPLVKQAALNSFYYKEMNYDDFDLSFITRIILRIVDIEDALQYSIKERINSDNLRR